MTDPNTDEIVDLVTQEVSLVQGPANARTNLVLKSKDSAVMETPITPSVQEPEAAAQNPPQVTPPVAVAPVAPVAQEPAPVVAIVTPPEPVAVVAPAPVAPVEAVESNDDDIADVIQLSRAFEGVEDESTEEGQIAVAKSLDIIERLADRSVQLKASQGAVRKAMAAALHYTADVTKNVKGDNAQAVQKSIHGLSQLVQDVDPKAVMEQRASTALEKINKSLNGLTNVVQKSTQAAPAVSAQPAQPVAEAQPAVAPVKKSLDAAQAESIMKKFRS